MYHTHGRHQRHGVSSTEYLNQAMDYMIHTQMVLSYWLNGAGTHKPASYAHRLLQKYHEHSTEQNLPCPFICKLHCCLALSLLILQWAVQQQDAGVGNTPPHTTRNYNILVKHHTLQHLQAAAAAAGGWATFSEPETKWAYHNNTQWCQGTTQALNHTS